MSDEFFRGAEFLRAEGVTHTLRIESGGTELVAPLIVREIPAGGSDAVSPYGYSGVVPLGGEALTEALEPETVDWSDTGLVSAFLRGTALGPHALAGAERSELQISDPGLERKSRMSDRQQVRRNEARGYTAEILPGPDAARPERDGFLRAYEQTMVRTEAAQRYFFGREWFDTVLSSPRAWLALIRAPGGEIAAASIATLSDEVLHYYLSGTGNEHLGDAPMKNLIVALQDLSDELDVPLNLGGGLRPGDGLEEFKRGFANRRAPFLTHQIVCDREAYDRLSEGRSAGEFFPAYRA